MTTEIYSTIPPTDGGWYWVRISQTLGSLNRRVIERSPSGIWYFGGGMTDRQMVDHGYLFGPRIPTAEELVEMRKTISDWAMAELVKEGERLGLYEGETKGGET